MKKTFVTGFVLIYFILPVSAQTVEQTIDSSVRKNNFYASFGFGGAWLKEVDDMATVGLSLACSRNHHQLSFQFVYASPILNLFNSDYYEYETYNLLYGYSFEWKRLTLVPQTGFNYINKNLQQNNGGGGFFDSESSPNYVKINEGKAVGMQLGLTALCYYKRWGIGMQALQGFNKQGNILNIGAMLRFRINRAK